VLADIAIEQPAHAAVTWSFLFHEADVPPRRCGEMQGVIVALPAPVHPVGRQGVPLLARDLARFAADTDGGIREKGH